MKCTENVFNIFLLFKITCISDTKDPFASAYLWDYNNIE